MNKLHKSRLVKMIINSKNIDELNKIIYTCCDFDNVSDFMANKIAPKDYPEIYGIKAKALSFLYPLKGQPINKD